MWNGTRGHPPFRAGRKEEAARRIEERELARAGDGRAEARAVRKSIKG